MDRDSKIVGTIVIAIVVAIGTYVGVIYREDKGIDAHAQARQMVHDAVQADIDGNYAKGCILYREIIAKGISIDAYEIRYLEHACAKAR